MSDLTKDPVVDPQIIYDLLQQIERLRTENDQLRQIALLNAETLKGVVAARLGEQA